MGLKLNDVQGIADHLLACRKAYYAGKPLISDAEFDDLEDRLRGLDPNHPVLHLVGAEVKSENKKIEHRTPMLSLGKTYQISQLQSWIDGRPVVGTWKIDGNSLSLVFEDGKLVVGKTRGNGKIGELVTDKIRWVGEIPKSISDRRNLEVRGELYCTAANFVKLADEMAKLGLDRPTNPRNIVAGVLGRKSHGDLARYFSFFAFNLLFEQESASAVFARERTKFQYFDTIGFHHPPIRVCEDWSDVEAFLGEVQNAMTQTEIGVDGAVFTYDDLALHDELGATSHHPRYRLSFKWPGTTARSKVQEIQWNTSRLGIVTPVAVIEPVELSGARITNVALHNAGFVLSYQIKAGDLIEVIRSGEVIPKFLSVVEAAPGEVQLPEDCPSCRAKLELVEIRLICPNQAACPAQKIRTILNWIQAVGIDDLSEKRLQQMIDLGLVSAIPDLYRLDEAQLLRLPLVKEKMATKLLSNIKASRILPLPVFLTGLGIDGAGLATWEPLSEMFPSLEAIRALSVEELAAIKGFAEKSSQAIVRSLEVKSGLIDELLKEGLQITLPTRISTGQKRRWEGLNFVITGTLSKPRKEIESFLKEQGGKAVGSVSQNTYALICNEKDSDSSKAVKARELGIPFWTEEELFSAT